MNATRIEKRNEAKEVFFDIIFEFRFRFHYTLLTYRGRLIQKFFRLIFVLISLIYSNVLFPSITNSHSIHLFAEHFFVFRWPLLIWQCLSRCPVSNFDRMRDNFAASLFPSIGTKRTSYYGLTSLHIEATRTKIILSTRVSISYVNDFLLYFSSIIRWIIKLFVVFSFLLCNVFVQ